MALTDGLEAFWKLDDETDSSGNSHALTNNNSATFVAGKVGNAADFVSASEQTLSIANASLGALNPSGTAYSLSLWYYINTASQVLIHTLDGEGGGYYMVAGNNFGSMELHFNNINAGFAFLPTTAGAWHHIAVSVSATGDCNYMHDGGTYTAGTTSSAPVASIIDFSIGGGGGSYMNGNLDAIGFWSRELSEAEMLELWNDGNGLEYPFAGGGGSAGARRRRILLRNNT